VSVLGVIESVFVCFIYQYGLQRYTVL